MIFGNICKVPKSAAIPISIYLIVNLASCVQYRISPMQIRSIPPPTHALWIPISTGTLHYIMHKNCFCIFNM